MPFHVQIYGAFAGGLEKLADRHGMLPSEDDTADQFDYATPPANWAAFKQRVQNARIGADRRLYAHFNDWVGRQRRMSGVVSRRRELTRHLTRVC